MSDAAAPTTLAHQWLQCDLVIREQTEEKARIAAELIATMQPGGEVRLPNGAGVRMVAPRQQFDPELAMKVLTPEQLSAISKTTPSPKLAADPNLLPPALYALCRKSSGEPSLRRV